MAGSGAERSGGFLPGFPAPLGSRYIFPSAGDPICTAAGSKAHGVVPPMKHFDLTEWADYVRGVTDAQTSALEDHLRTGCSACAGLVARLRAVVELAAVDEQYEPPPHALRFARAAFSLREPEPRWGLPAVVARVVFDSLEAVAPAGVRGPVEEISRQTLFEAGDYAVHLRFEQPAGTSRVRLVGQVSDRRAPDPPFAHVPIVLAHGRTVVARSLSNEFGEFQLEYEPRTALTLHLSVSDGSQRIKLALDEHEDAPPISQPRSRRASKKRRR